MNLRSDESGQVLVLVVGLALVAFASAGLAVDGTRAFLLRRSLQNSADAAATAAASTIDEATIYSSGSVALDADRARLVALNMLQRRRLPQGTDLDLEVTVDGVSLGLTSRLPTSFLGLVGLDSVPVAVVSEAAPFTSE